MTRCSCWIAGLLAVASGASLSHAEAGFAFGEVRFEENRGQTGGEVQYIARARGQQIFLTDRGIVVAPAGGPQALLKFEGSTPAVWRGEGQQKETISYAIGSDPGKWVTGAPMFERAAWRGVYPGVDLIVYGAGARLEYDLVLAPGADPDRIRLKIEGGDAARLKEDGAIEFANGMVRQRAPVIFQEPGRRRVEGRFEKASGEALKLRVGRYDRAKRLVIDPVLETAVYLGGEGNDTVTALGDGLIAGSTDSLVFAGAQAAVRRGRDIFIRGTGAIVPGTAGPSWFVGTIILGGSGDEEVASVARNSSPSGRITVAGTTTSTDFPGATGYKGGRSDGFIAQLETRQYGVSLRTAEYIGGAGEDRILSYGNSSSFEAIAGVTDSPDLPAAGFQSAPGGAKDGFFGARSTLRTDWWLTYLGGSGDDDAFAASVRAMGGRTEVWIGGETKSADFPGLPDRLSGGSDGFLIRVPFQSLTPPQPAGASYYRIGGNGEDRILALAGTPSTVTEVTGNYNPLAPSQISPGVGFSGSTTSTDLPVHNAAQDKSGGAMDAFAGMWNVEAGKPEWITYLGGSGNEEGSTVAVNWAGELYVGGWTESTDLPVVRPLQASPGGGRDGLAGLISSTGELMHLSYWGGSGDDSISGVRLVFNNTLRMGGTTSSTDLIRGTSVERGAAQEGFIAEAGFDVLTGPATLIMAKDGLLRFSLRAARAAFRLPVSYRSSDVSKVRFLYLGRSLEEVTAAAEDDMTLEALAESGEVEITATAPGFQPKRIVVKLHPGAYVPVVPKAISLWQSSNFIGYSYRAIDPVSGQPLALTDGLRPGVPQPSIQWKVSDESVVRLEEGGGTRLQPLRTGEATIALVVEGYSVVGAETLVTVKRPQFHVQTPVKLGRDLVGVLPVWWAMDGVIPGSGHKGTLTARSADPSKLRLTFSAEKPGQESVTAVMSGRPATVLAEALSGEGQVEVVFTSSEFEGTVSMIVELEPAVLKWGTFTFVGGVQVANPLVTTRAGDDPLWLGTALTSRSSGIGQALRAGAPELRLSLSNSNPGIVQLNRLTRVWGNNDENYRLKGLEPGTAQLRMTLPGSHVELENETVQVVVTPGAAAQLVMPATAAVGKDLQREVRVAYTGPPAQMTVRTDRPEALLISEDRQRAGSSSVLIGPGAFSRTEYVFYLNGLESAGRAKVSVSIPGLAAKEIDIALSPSGAGFIGSSEAVTSGGFNRRIRVGAWLLDQSGRVGIEQAEIRPGAQIGVRLRAEGEGIRLSRETATLRSGQGMEFVEYTLPPEGEEGFLFVEGAQGLAGPEYLAKLKVRGAASAGITANLNTVLLSRDQLEAFQFTRPMGTAVAVTSSDPQRLLVSRAPGEAGSASVTVPADSQPIVYLHALGGAGRAVLRFEGTGVQPFEVTVGLQPMVFSLQTRELFVGAANEATASLRPFGRRRPGAETIRVGLRIADPRIATLTPEVLDIGLEGIPSGLPVRIQGLSEGVTRIEIQAPAGVYTPLGSLPIVVRNQQPRFVTYALGKNLQGGLQMDRGRAPAGGSGAIVKITSSDPAKVLLSRSASSPGSASISVAAPAGDTKTQLFYVQALDSEGEVTVTASGDGLETSALVRLSPAWLGCQSPMTRLAAGGFTDVLCRFMFLPGSEGTSSQLASITPRAGMDGAEVRFTTTAPEVFMLTPSTGVLSTQVGGYTLRLQGLAAGKGELRVEPVEGFGNAVDGSDKVAIQVDAAAMPVGCGPEITLYRDLQVNCTGYLPIGAEITLVSEQPNLLVVSGSPKAAGTREARIRIGEGGAGIWLQPLAGRGTAEVTLRGAGFKDHRIAAVLVPTELAINAPTTGAPPTLATKVGGTAAVSLAPLSTGSPLSPQVRPGATIAVEFAAEPAGVVSFEPPIVNLNEATSSATVHLKAIGGGTAVVRVKAPEGVNVSGVPIVVSVQP